MILVADSGSTKCDWVLIQDDKPFKRFSTIGFNPYFHNEAIISGTLRRKQALIPYLDQIEQTFFYGAGCSTDELRQVVARSLYSIFSKSKVHIGHDLDAAAFSTYTGKPSIACILGTGSNSCYYDGENVIEAVPALAFILGDEGSGSYYGKKILADFLYGRLPSEIHQGLVEEFGLNKNKIMHNVYMKPHANVYLASFMRFIHGYKSNEYVQDMILEGMNAFLSTHVTCFDNCREVDSNFVGSVAYYFSDILHQAGSKLDIPIGHIEKKPINGLVKYHLEKQEELI
ncbi:MAG: glucosamine kinase [Limisphaerales bacterium]|jgi:glucosamine kinase